MALPQWAPGPPPLRPACGGEQPPAEGEGGGGRRRESSPSALPGVQAPVASAHAAQEKVGRQEYLDAIDEIIESGGEQFLHAALEQAHARYGDKRKLGS